MKKCSNCCRNFDDVINFCPDCGVQLVEMQQEVTQQVEEQVVDGAEVKVSIFCSHCGKVIDDDSVKFCCECGNSLHNDKVEENTLENVKSKITENDFVKSVKQDINNSQSISMIKDKAKTTVSNAKEANTYSSGKFKKIIPIIAVLVLIIVCATNIHKCEECEKIYFGKEHTISFWGESAQTCEECYNNFYYGW